MHSDDADMAILDNMEKSECSRQNAMVDDFEVDMVADMIADMVADLEVVDPTWWPTWTLFCKKKTYSRYIKIGKCA